MGRGSPTQPFPPGERVHLQRVRLNSGGYDQGGAYWGSGQSLWCAFTCEADAIYLRANSREAAKQHQSLKHCKFWR